jgi:uncharacterized protein (DUF433 family)
MALEMKKCHAFRRDLAGPWLASVVLPGGRKYHGVRRRISAMTETAREWKYLERRPGSSYQQLCIKGTRIWAWTLFCEFMSEKEPRTPAQLAEDWGVPLEAVQEAIAYGQSDPPEIREDKRKNDLRAEATGLNDPAIRRTGRPRPLPTDQRVRLGL